MAPDGTFLVAWSQIIAQTNGVVTDSVIIGRLFDRFGNPHVDDDGDPLGDFRLDTDAGAGGTATARTARNPQVAADAEGNFLVVWESFIDDDAGYDVFYQQLVRTVDEPDDEDDEEVVTWTLGFSGQANMTQFAGHQVNPSVAIDADGDFVIVWNGLGAQPHPTDPANEDMWADHDNEGVFLRFFNAVGDPVGVQQRVNRTEAGIQHFPSIAMTPEGTAVVVWSGRGVGDRHGIFARRYTEGTDTAGPLATELRENDAARTRPAPRDGTIFNNPEDLVVVFNEQLDIAGGATGADSVLNPNNWALTRLDGAEVQGAIDRVGFTFNTDTNKWEAVVTFNEALPNAHYILVVRSNVRDVAGNPLARTGLAQEGLADLPFPPTSPTGGFGFVFRVDSMVPATPGPGETDRAVNNNENLTPEQMAEGLDVEAGNQNQPAVAKAPDGRYVVVWTTPSLQSVVDPDDPDAPPQLELGPPNIMGQRFGPRGEPLGEPVVVNALTDGNQADAAVAIDHNGNFVVVWSGAGALLGDDAGIFAQRFDANGNAVGGQFRVNQVTQFTQDQPTVAMDGDGNFVIAWASYGQDRRTSNTTASVFARVYNRHGISQTDEFLVNTYQYGSQRKPHAAMAQDGSFVIVWQDDTQDGNQWGVYGQRFSATGAKLGGEFRVNTRVADKQQDPRVAIDVNGNFIVVYTDFGQDGSGWGVYARRYNAAGVALDAQEFRVNQHTLNNQWQPSVGMDSAGNFVITWSTFGQDRNDGQRDYGIFARMYNADRSDWINPATGTALGEFRINATVEGNQVTPDVAVAANGNYVVVWAGPDGDGTGIFHRPVGINTNTTAPDNSGSTGGSGGSGGNTGGGTTFTTHELAGWAGAVGGGWWLAESNGLDTFTNQQWSRWSTAVNWVDVMVGDFTGNGLDDIVGRVEGTGDWWLAKNNGNGTFTNERWGRWSTAVDWVDVMVADFTGDGRADIAGRVAGSGDWWVAKSNGTAFANERWGRWSTAVDWLDVSVGDFNGDGRADLVGRVESSGDLWVAKSNEAGNGFTNQRWGRWSATAGWDHVLVGNFAAAALHAAHAPPADQPAPAAITLANLEPIVEEAIFRLPDGLEGLSFQIHIADLAGLKLGQTSGNTIWIDHNAAGFGWFIDPTPADNSQFRPTARVGELEALPGSDAAQRVDLLTVVMHEFAHLLGHGHSEGGLMQTALEPGVRWLPIDDLAPADALALESAWADSPHGALAWLDDLAAANRREKQSDRELQVQAVDEALLLYWK